MNYQDALNAAAQGAKIDFMADYDWPIQRDFEPLPGQQAVANHMVGHPKSFVFSDTRTGKSLAALWAIDRIRRMAKSRVQAIIVSDILPLDDTWAYTIFTNFLGRMNYVIVHGTVEQRLRALDKDVDIYLINFEGLRIGYPKDTSTISENGKRRYMTDKELAAATKSVARKILEKEHLKIAVFDEATTYRNKMTWNSRAAIGLLSKRLPFVWALTGTPVPNGAIDAYGLKKLVHPYHRLTYKQWEDTVTSPHPHSMFKRIDKPDAAERVNELLQPAIRITQEQCFNVTPLVTKTINIQLSDEQKEWMQVLKNELVILTQNGEEISAVNQAALRAKFIQISCGAIYDDEHGTHRIDASVRIDAYTKLVEGIPGKIITFAPLINVVELLHERLNGSAIKIDSGLSRNAKLEVLREFESGDKKTLISHPGPIARGLDLSVANYIIWYAPIDRTEYYVQANERINGPNQTKSRYIIRLASCSIEREIYEATERDISMMGLILKLKELVL